MPLVLYLLPHSGPCRAVLMTAAHLRLNAVKKHVNVMGGEHKTSEFRKLNLAQTVPVMNDNGFILWESRAIMGYLVDKYAPDSPLYPKNPEARGVVEQMLYFDAGHICKSIVEFYIPQVFAGHAKNPKKEQNLKRSFTIFEGILEKSSYAAANHLTIADYSLLSNVAFAQEVLEWNFQSLPFTLAWLQRMRKETPHYKEINESPLLQLKEMWKSGNFKKAS